MDRQAVGTGSVGPVRWSSARWCAYYRANREKLLDLPWEEEVRLTEAERATITKSVQDFQLGESSDGRNLIRAAREYAAASGDGDYPEAIRLFIAEEQRHSGDLGRFLTKADIPLLTRTWTDTIFRWLRRLAGLELFLTVLVTAEMIGKVYYKALRKATGCLLLRRLCEQLLRDEMKHIRFHVERLALLRRDRPRWKVIWAQAWHRFLFGGTCLVVWWRHRAVFKAGGYRFRRFWAEAWNEINAAQRPIDPHDLGMLPAGRKPVAAVG
jgi:hypothetical protein